MKLVRDFLPMKVIKTLQLLNFNFLVQSELILTLVQFGDITCHESIYLLTVLNALECGRTKN